MSESQVLVFGGTSDARFICQILDEQRITYTLSVATAVGKELAGNISGKIRVGRIDADEIADLLMSSAVRWVIDASHPYAELLGRNIHQACETVGVPLSRYQRRSELNDLEHPQLHKVANLQAACSVALQYGPRVLLTTGSKELAAWQQGLPGKMLLARVLPTSEVIAECEALGLGVDNIFALRGPFSAEFNDAIYAFCSPDVVITKESGAEGGYLDKVTPALARGIPCIVVTRPQPRVSGAELLASRDDVSRRVTRWLQERKE
ncbi:cobalt-precorrin-6A reductase [Buttiauxella sp. A111]|uniref:cobalt-precorrin-6A reductase n=1 Tax=Buttiauxella sp. A111 TaxID=2563088 RepID=UPI0010E373B1|nr:cobalt-precorrin-6A reductase [Buttiauxella sp. A111]GDX04529.1 cobalt-precorrin-6A reductase [Buttiauxella sp. A111]